MCIESMRASVQRQRIYLWYCRGLTVHNDEQKWNFKLPDLHQKMIPKLFFYSPITLTVVLKTHKKNYGLLIPYGIIIPSLGVIRCQESGLNIVGIQSTGLLLKN